ncbi:Sec-independent protein translocase protein TatB [Porphyrobacter sp. ULC335]|uniref:Sec-independent protein translocase protein TatB n=1 Tax=Porphyrobacter sp. ULC335 TaxID=2854260 RepID=UPI00221EBF0A|nr:Sec-independent protein translocase protein TatB [Porphyrobacter sp. ULC335]UYV17197.1 Sec-independent protein translocase protein TatB [Porphyrobacter sp. ULC335]
MLDVGIGELLVILIVAVVVIGPKDLPLAMRTAGRWIGKMRRMSAHFRSGIDTMVREAELEEMEKKWKAQNEEIMRRSAALTEAEAGAPVMTGPPPIDTAPVETPTPVAAPVDVTAAPAVYTPPVEAVAEPLAQVPAPDTSPKGVSDV